MTLGDSGRTEGPERSLSGGAPTHPRISAAATGLLGLRAGSRAHPGADRARPPPPEWLPGWGSKGAGGLGARGRARLSPTHKRVGGGTRPGTLSDTGGPAARCTALGPVHSHAPQGPPKWPGQQGPPRGPGCSWLSPPPALEPPSLTLVAEPRGQWQPCCSDFHRGTPEAGQTRPWALPKSEALQTALATCRSAPASEAGDVRPRRQAARVGGGPEPARGRSEDTQQASC